MPISKARKLKVQVRHQSALDGNVQGGGATGEASAAVASGGGHAPRAARAPAQSNAPPRDRVQYSLNCVLPFACSLRHRDWSSGLRVIASFACTHDSQYNVWVRHHSALDGNVQGGGPTGEASAAVASGGGQAARAAPAPAPARPRPRERARAAVFSQLCFSHPLARCVAEIGN